MCINLSIKRPRTPLISLSLLPFAILTLLRAAISYSPRLFGNLAITSLVNRLHAVHCAIFFSYSVLVSGRWRRRFTILDIMKYAPKSPIIAAKNIFVVSGTGGVKVIANASKLVPYAISCCIKPLLSCTKLTIAHLCYNTTYKSPPKVRWARLELADRLHGSAFQKHRVCHSTTSAPCLISPLLFSPIHAIISCVIVSIYLYISCYLQRILATNYNRTKILCQ